MHVRENILDVFRISILESFHSPVSLHIVPPPPLPSSPLLPLLISGLFSSSHQANQRKLVEHIVAGSVKKIEKLLEQGLDPNFVTEDGSELQAPPLVGLFTQLLPLRS